MSELSIEQAQLSPKLTIKRVLTGLWQVADIERHSGIIDPDVGADYLQAYVDAGFTSFDMADHYGSAELLMGKLLQRSDTHTRPIAATKWCPEPGSMSAEVVRRGVEERLARLSIDCIDLLQFHWWSFEHPAWLDALHELTHLREEGLIGEIGVTNFDAAHLKVALADGVPICANQVSFSMLDQRAAGALTELCSDHPVKLLAYGTLAGGFLSERWLDKGEPADIPDWSKMKYQRFIDTMGGWHVFQTLLQTLSKLAIKHQVSISNIATKWVLEQSAVAGVIIGARLGENMHALENTRLFTFSLDEEDQNLLSNAFALMQAIPGDCGDEYRKPPFLTASGDLSHHLDQMPQCHVAKEAAHRPDATWVSSGSEWEDIAGYCRAQRIGDRIVVSGTTATAGAGRVVAPGDAGAQATFILDKILAAITALGGDVNDIIRTRVYLTNADDVLAVSKAHGRIFNTIKPANTLIVVAQLIGDYCVEIEAEALMRSHAG